MPVIVNMSTFFCLFYLELKFTNII